jgi:hypothetical protein
MESIGILVCIFTSVFFAIFIAILLPLIFSGKQWEAAQAKARARRLADARMNARLLRFNL